jgi:thiamine-phosphate pyrophosphorylase
LLLYYITDRTQFPGSDSERRERLLRKISEAALVGVDYIQLREKDLSGRALECLAEEAAQLIHDSRRSTHLLINSRTDIALAANADGVHLTSNDISPLDVKKIWREARSSEPIIAVSCHSEADIAAVQSESDFVLFSPVFEKRGAKEIAGTDQLQKACRHRVPVLALGGVTTENAHLCIAGGASGIAGIRLFQENDIASVVTKLRGLR